MEQTDMTMTRTQYEHTCAVKAGIIHALRDNLGDEFSAKEIAVSHPDHSADTGNMVMTSEARQEPRHDP